METKEYQITETLREYAHLAIQKHFKKSVKYEAAVLKDSNPEPLHQMRVGMRRLRTALHVFEPALDLPEEAGDRQIKKIAQRLGAVRDLDVLETALKERYRPQLKGKEQKRLDQILDELEKQRDRQFSQIKKLFDSQQYRKFKQVFQAWLDQPRYGAIAPLPLLQVLPDLLLPLISQLLLHPGWLVSTTVESGEIKLPNSLDAEPLNQQLDEHAEELHDLRKQMKQVRYQTEFFTEFYEPTYKQRVQEFQAVQEILGELQDCAILSDFLTSILPDWQKQLPTLAQQVEENRIRAWANWQPIQQQYLNPDFREQLRQLVATPLKANP